MSHIKGSVMFEDSNNLHAMNEKVQNLANGVYKEFESVIVRFGGDAVKGLMPVVVNILECLDQNIKLKQEFEVNVELSKSEIEHLKIQCDKEKILRKSVDLKYLETEDLLEEAKKQFNNLKTSSELNAKRFEMKIKNLHDHVSRLEDKEIRLKDDYSKLHSKYSDLLKNHTDLVQKTSQIHSSISGSSAKNQSELSEVKKCTNSQANTTYTTSSSRTETSMILHQSEQAVNVVVVDDEKVKNELNLLTEIALANSETSSVPQHQQEVKHSTETITESVPSEQPSKETTVTSEWTIEITDLEESSNSGPESFKSSGNHSLEDLTQDNSVVDNLYDKCLVASNTLRIEDLKNTLLPASHLFEIEEDTLLIEGNRQSDYAVSVESEGNTEKNVSLYDELNALDDVGDDFLSVSAEVDKLIQENTELLATKNALNVLKDDLIANVEELTGELELLKGEFASLQNEKNQQELRICELEEELKKSREEISEFRIKLEAKEQEDDAGKGIFSRVELVRLLMEKNQYKEKLMELQEAVRRAETMRASRAHPELAVNDIRKSKSSSMWGIFNSFLGRDKDES